MRRCILLVLCALVLAPVPIVVTATAASACSCAFSEPDELVGMADAIVTGTVTDIDRPRWSMGTDPVWYTLDVDGVYQGDATATLVFASAADGASCGLENMRADTRYVVFLTDGSKRQPYVSDGLTSNLCSGTQEYDGTGPMADTLADLGGDPPRAGTTGSVPVASGSVQPWLLATGGAVLAAGIALLVLRLRRRAS